METIQTKRLDLQLITPDDAPDIFVYAQDEAVAENTSWHPHKNVEETRAFIAHAVARMNLENGALHTTWAIRESGASKVIGTISLVRDNELEAHIDYALARAYWGRGYMSEGVQCMVRWCFDRLHKLQRINSGCLSRNIGSVHVLKKNGFKVTETYKSRRGAKFDNKILETTLFTLTRADWMAKCAVHR